MIDLIIAYALSNITHLKQKRDTTQQKLKVERNWIPISPTTVAALYLFNPFSILSCVSKSTLLFTNLSIVLSLLSALKGKTKPTMFWIALASYLSFYPAMLVPALFLILDDGKTVMNLMVENLQVLYWPPSLCRSLMHLGYFWVGWRSYLDYLECILDRGISCIPPTVQCKFISSVWRRLSTKERIYIFSIFVTDLTPNVGMFWYFFIEIFDQFRSFFMVVFQFHTFIFTIPVCIKLR